ncbi:MAG: type 2 isopentenyl-diphosphate Delta-isomerase [Holosporaceae bacterium]|jgi:isopentenyl-diphosphate delta-isomerase|nr:type 2 isopentenyl-diphosphate Delta-isomerase [Holosporaceae bacterium]
MKEIQLRKDNHVALALADAVRTSAASGLDDYRLEHNALPEIDFSKIDTSVTFLGRRMNLPLVISSITGGGGISGKINMALAGVANDFNIGFSVGSQRCVIDDARLKKSFLVRSFAPNILLLANLGAAQLNYGYSIDECRKAVDMIGADALTLHLNPLQEAFQHSGTTNFSGLLKKIEVVCKKLDTPVIVKEVGYGISASVAKKLADVGVYAIETAGGCSISWSELETIKTNDIVLKKAAEAFANWGNPTTECIKSIAENVGKVKIIASGGIDTGVKMAKSIALGADLCGIASAFLKKVMESRSECENFVETLSFELKVAMFCVGCQNVQQLKSAKIVKVR